RRIETRKLPSCGIGGAPRSSLGTPTRLPSAPPAPGRGGRCEPSSSTASPSSSGSVISTPSSGCADRVRRCAIATPIVGRLLKEEEAHRRYKESTFGGKAASL